VEKKGRLKKGKNKHTLHQSHQVPKDGWPLTRRGGVPLHSREKKKKSDKGDLMDGLPVGTGFEVEMGGGAGPERIIFLA